MKKTTHLIAGREVVACVKRRKCGGWVAKITDAVSDEFLAAATALDRGRRGRAPSAIIEAVRDTALALAKEALSRRTRLAAWGVRP